MKNNQIARCELQVGTALSHPAYDRDGKLLLKEGYIIRSEAQLDALFDRGLYRRPDDAPGHHVSEDEAEQASRECPFDTISDLTDRLKRALALLERGQAEGINRLQRITVALQKACNTDADAALGAVHLWYDDSYAIAHSIHTAILTELVLRRLKKTPQQRASAVAGALTSNLAMLALQNRLYEQKDPLSEQQREAIHNHPQESCRLLKEAGLTDQVWLDVVGQHHERPNGEGYTSGLKTSEIALEARVLALADIYGAMITPRAYRPGLVAKEALRKIFLARGQDVDEELALVFIKELGVFPPGSMVNLANGEKAVVVRRAKESTEPMVMSITTARGTPFPKPMKRRCNGGEYAVKGMLPRGQDMGLNLRVLWDYV